jgi:hypothetical protein
VDLKFTSPDLRRLDLFVGEVLVLPVLEGERPPRGLAGLVDYRLAGALSRALSDGSFSGALGQLHELSPRPRLAFDRALLLGSGKAEEFNPPVLAGLLDLLTDHLRARGTRRVVLELPGRARGLIEPELAVDLLLDRTEGEALFDTWTLVEDADATRRIQGRLRQDRDARWGARR